jgi:hypothetical protein
MDFTDERLDLQTPTQAEIDTILAPWRSLGCRAAAIRMWYSRRDYAILLRTYYGDNNSKWNDWLEMQRHYSGVDDESDWWRVLDDRSLFDFGDNPDAWRQIFDILPELAGPEQGNSRVIMGPLAYPYDGYVEWVRENQQKLRDELQRKISSLEERGQLDMDLPSFVEGHGTYGVELQLIATDSWLLVADKEAFESDRPLVVFLDRKGNTVRFSRIDIDDIDDIVNHLTIAFPMGRLGTNQLWDENRSEGEAPPSTLGEKYRVTGEMGRSLYDVDDLLNDRNTISGISHAINDMELGT